MKFKEMDFKVQGPQITQFNSIAPKSVPRSSFKRDFNHRTTLNTDYLYPIFSDEIYPGDDLHIKMTSLIRITTPIKPIMDNLYAETFWFFVPFRLVWANWVKLQGEQTNPGDSTNYILPQISFSAGTGTNKFAQGGVADYLGMPTNIDFTTNNPGITSLYHRAYQLVWDQWFRDENLTASVFNNNVGDSNDPLTTAFDSLLKRLKRKDYFTGALPFLQKGTASTISVGGHAPLTFPSGIGTVNLTRATTTSSIPVNGVATAAYTTNDDTITASQTARTYHAITGSGTGPSDAYADLSAATAITINALRQAALYQQILELDARGGTRYVESLFSRFGVVSPDFRLQRPELIGMGHTPVNIYAVPQTGGTGGTGTTTPQGNLAAFGTSVQSGQHQAKYAATEHGIVLGLLNIRADLTYQQGLDRRFTRSQRLDFYEPLLNGLGEQAILNKEIYADGSTNDALTFGYNERFSDLRVRNSMITNRYRSTDPLPLDVWHLSQKFTTTPILGSDAFIKEAVPMSRVVAVTTEPEFYCDMHFQYNHVRPMPIRSTPGIDIL